MLWVDGRQAGTERASDMYVCICNAVTDSAIREAVGEGARSLRDLSAKTGCSTQCGRCVHVAREVMDAALKQIGVSQTAVDLEIVASS